MIDDGKICVIILAIIMFTFIGSCIWSYIMGDGDYD